MDEERSRFNPARFPRVTQQALDFYKRGASDEEKKTLATTILKAAKKIKKDARENAEGKKDKKRRQQPSAEQLAAGLYKILSETETASVSGDPASGGPTKLQGQVDLNEVARKLLALDTSQRPEGPRG